MTETQRTPEWFLLRKMAISGTTAYKLLTAFAKMKEFLPEYHEKPSSSEILELVIETPEFENVRQVFSMMNIKVTATSNKIQETLSHESNLQIMTEDKLKKLKRDQIVELIYRNWPSMKLLKSITKTDAMQKVI